MDQGESRQHGKQLCTIIGRITGIRNFENCDIVKRKIRTKFHQRVHSFYTMSMYVSESSEKFQKQKHLEVTQGNPKGYKSSDGFVHFNT